MDIVGYRIPCTAGGGDICSQTRIHGDSIVCYVTRGDNGELKLILTNGTDHIEVPLMRIRTQTSSGRKVSRVSRNGTQVRSVLNLANTQ